MIKVFAFGFETRNKAISSLIYHLLYSFIDQSINEAVK